MKQHYNKAISDILTDIDQSISEHELIVSGDKGLIKRYFGELKLYHKEIEVLKHWRLLIEKKRMK